MATQGPNSPGTAANDAAVGTVAWVNPNNAKISDGVFTTFTSATNVTSHYLKLTNYGFTIPSGATINGIEVDIQRKGSTANTTTHTRDLVVSIVKSDGSIGSTNEALLTTNWPAIEATQIYGGSSDLWGETWADSDINNSNFGMVVQAKNQTSAGNPTGSIDFVSITVTYTPIATQSNGAFLVNFL